MGPKAFADAVLDWFDRHGRKDLPWQRDISPYRVWVSEIMLQQTQVRTVIPYFERFMQAFGDVATLAAADDDAVLHHWTGLGYYSRARNLHKTARLIVAEHGGHLPDDVDTLASLPGIGRSTAGAIVAIAMQQRAAILDGNVKRVLARFHAVDGWPGESAVGRRLWELAERYTPTARVHHYTQAMMDLGATVCTRTRPACALCPLTDHCAGRAAGTPERWPGRKPKKPLPVRRTRMLLVQAGADDVCLHKRPPSGIWGGLWSFPELAEDDDVERWVAANHGVEPATIEPWQPLRHTFSHFHLDIEPIRVRLAAAPRTGVAETGTVWYNLRRPEALGLAAPVKKLLASLQAAQITP